MKTKRPSLLRWLPGVIITILVIALIAWMNWSRVAFRDARVIGLDESQLISRFGPPDLDTSRLTPWRPGRPQTEQERIEANADPLSDYDLIWYTFIGATHARVRIVNGAAVSVEHGTHR